MFASELMNEPHKRLTTLKMVRHGVEAIVLSSVGAAA